MQIMGSIPHVGATKRIYFGFFFFLKTKGKSTFLESGSLGHHYIVNNIKMGLFLYI